MFERKWSLRACASLTVQAQPAQPVSSFAVRAATCSSTTHESQVRGASDGVHSVRWQRQCMPLQYANGSPTTSRTHAVISRSTRSLGQHIFLPLRWTFVLPDLCERAAHLRFVVRRAAVRVLARYACQERRRARRRVLSACAHTIGCHGLRAAAHSHRYAFYGQSQRQGACAKALPAMHSDERFAPPCIKHKASHRSGVRHAERCQYHESVVQRFPILTRLLTHHSPQSEHTIHPGSSAPPRPSIDGTITSTLPCVPAARSASTRRMSASAFSCAALRLAALRSSISTL